VVAAGNFSIMAAILKRAAALAAQHLRHWEIVDYASAEKPDVPSGTSRELAEALAEVRTPEPAVPLSQLGGPIEAAAPKWRAPGSTRYDCPASW
jgi:4-hydroxy-tetrahydrodipicolinate reductase